MGEEAPLLAIQEIGTWWAEGWQLWEYEKLCTPFFQGQLPAFLQATPQPSPQAVSQGHLTPATSLLCYFFSLRPKFSGEDTQLWRQLL